MAGIRYSYATFGQQKPIKILADGTVIAGNAQLQAMLDLGWDRAACSVYPDEKTARAFALADNRTGELAEWDRRVLADELASIEASGDVAAVDLGWEESERLALGLPKKAKEAQRVEQSDELERKWGTERGQVWLLGEHRLMCGDSTDPADVRRLMDGQRTRLLSTDPPYLVDYHGNDAGGGKVWAQYHEHAADSGLYEKFLAVALAEACADTCSVYQWFSDSRTDVVWQAWDKVGLQRHQILVWVKEHGVLTQCEYMQQHEPCQYGWRKWSRPTMRPSPKWTTVWSIAGESDGIHPTQKPLEIFTRPMEAHTTPGEIVFEPFSGSGSNLMAAQRVGRRCCAMEIAPGFVAAALERFHQGTGVLPVLGR